MGPLKPLVRAGDPTPILPPPCLIASSPVIPSAAWDLLFAANTTRPRPRDYSRPLFTVPAVPPLPQRPTPSPSFPKFASPLIFRHLTQQADFVFRLRSRQRLALR